MKNPLLIVFTLDTMLPDVNAPVSSSALARAYSLHPDVYSNEKHALLNTRRLAPLEARAKIDRSFDLYSVAATVLQLTRNEVAAAYAQRFDPPFGGPVPEMIALKERLHDAGYDVGICADVDRSTHAMIDMRWPAVTESWGGPRFFSYEHGMTTPDQRVYQFFPVRKTLLIENDASHLDVASRVFGWGGAVYTGASSGAGSIAAVKDAVLKFRRSRA